MDNCEEKTEESMNISEEDNTEDSMDISSEEKTVNGLLSRREADCFRKELDETQNQKPKVSG